MGLSDCDSGAVIASHAMAIMSKARPAAMIQPNICSRRRHGVGGAKALGGPAPNSRGGAGGSAEADSVIGAAMLCYSDDTVKPVPQRDRRKLAIISDGTNGK